jgi:chromosome segregation protein
MRLSKIKLAGFKSFVDPTVLHLPSNLIGVVGPNGCGKSNIIDAVRWVMGESSARSLRGDNDDRCDLQRCGEPQAGRAGIHRTGLRQQRRSAGRSLGQLHRNRHQAAGWARRPVGLLSQRCPLPPPRHRRCFPRHRPGAAQLRDHRAGHDFADHRSPPEDLRVFFEEAAGISKYKERRRETETRIRHTRENLERLDDVRGELARQIQHLQRQARAAEQYREHRAEERRSQGGAVDPALARSAHRLCWSANRPCARRKPRWRRFMAEQRRLEAGSKPDGRGGWSSTTPITIRKAAITKPARRSAGSNSIYNISASCGGGARMNGRQTAAGAGTGLEAQLAQDRIQQTGTAGLQALADRRTGMDAGADRRGGCQRGADRAEDRPA